MEELVSIITPMYNCEKYIGKTIESVLAQDYSNWEMIIIDDCSTDYSFCLASKYAEKNERIKLLKLDKKSTSGAAGVRNAGLAIARGRFIAFLDSDDVYLPKKLSIQTAFMINNGYAFTYSDYYVYDQRKKTIIDEYRAPKKMTYRRLVKHNYIGCLTVMYDTKMFGNPLMPVEATKREDFAMWLQLLKHTDAFNVGLPLGIYRMYLGSVSSKKTQMMKYQYYVLRRIEKHNFLNASYYLFCWGILGILKYKKKKVREEALVDSLKKCM